MTPLKQTPGTWLSKERKLWLAGVAGAFLLGMALMNGVATKSATNWAWDRWWHAEKAATAAQQTQSTTSVPAMQTPTLAPKH